MKRVRAYPRTLSIWRTNSKGVRNLGAARDDPNCGGAQGTSLGALLAPIGILAFWEYHKSGNVDVGAALMIALGFAVGGFFGGHWAQDLPEPVLRRVLGGLMLVVGARLLLAR